MACVKILDSQSIGEEQRDERLRLYLVAAAALSSLKRFFLVFEYYINRGAQSAIKKNENSRIDQT